MDTATDTAQPALPLNRPDNGPLSDFAISPDGTPLRALTHGNATASSAIISYDTADFAAVSAETVPFTLDSVWSATISPDQSTIYGLGYILADPTEYDLQTITP